MGYYGNYLLGAGIQVPEAGLASCDDGFPGKRVGVGGEICGFVGVQRVYA